MLSKQSIFSLASVAFFGFLVWIIIQADAGAHNILIDTVDHIPYADKVGHMSIYGVFAVLLTLSLPWTQRTYLRLPLGCALVLVFALLEELSQGLFPARDLELGDALADCVGVYFAAFLLKSRRLNRGFNTLNNTL